MSLFLDDANIDNIKKVLEWGVVEGITTNQKILLDSGVKKPYIEAVRDLVDLILSYKPPAVDHLSVEITTTKELHRNVIDEATSLFLLCDELISVKIPMYASGFGLEVIHTLGRKGRGLSINATCLMDYNQAILALNAGASYVSLFFNRMIDYHLKVEKKDALSSRSLAFDTIGDVSAYVKKYNERNGADTKLICGSIRAPKDVEDCLVAGADIVTVPYKILLEMPKHPKTEETIVEFNRAWEEFAQRAADKGDEKR